ncbi:MAG: VCBS repeat-containing protein [Pirellulales bacterium]|nr:VCBS repeat-containing protein [Pirellulales bacterium]
MRESRHLAPAVWGIALLLTLAAPGNAQSPESARELDARRAIGKAHYENGDFKAAAGEFRRCIELAPESAADRLNLALVLLRANEHEESLRLLEETQRLEEKLPNAHYLRGIIYKREGKYEPGVESLLRIIAQDEACWGAYYNLGTCYKFLKEYDKAKEAFQNAVRIDPKHPSAYYQLITLARRTGDVEEAKRNAEIFDRIKDTVDDSQKTPEALERSRYSQIIELPRLTPDAAEGPAAAVRFTEGTAEAGLAPSAMTSSAPLPARPSRFQKAEYDAVDARNRYLPAIGGAVVLGDYDGDSDLDVYVVHCASDPQASGNRLYRNEGQGRFVDVTAAAGVGDTAMGTDAVFGDYDNDGDNDLYVVNCGPNVLYQNQGDGTFADVSADARADEPQLGRQAVFVDYDHDNDLDILVANDVDLAEPPESDEFSLPADFYGQANALLRNNGNGTFTDQTDEAGMLVDMSQSRAVVSADFDGDYDLDVFVCNADAPSLFFANSRLGKFAAAAAFSPAIDGGASATAEGDFDRDGDPDLLVASGGALYLYTNGGKGDFHGDDLSAPPELAAAGVGRIDVFDYNNDAWLDVLLVGGDGRALALWEATGAHRFRDATEPAGLRQPWGQIADVAVGDLDGDGAEDIVLFTRDHGLRLLNNGGTPRHWIQVRLMGEKVNRSGYGASVEIASGGHYQRRTVHDGGVHFGLGSLDTIDVVRVTWPNGVAQNVIQPTVNGNLKIVEAVKVSASCTMLWTHNGERFELINEILGIGPLGVPMAPGVYHQPDCTELTKIEADQLVPQGGFYELRLTEELREITFADAMALRVVDHPAGLEIVPNEMFTAPPFPEDRLFAVADCRAPRSAVDDRGEDVLRLVRRRDGRFPEFPLTGYQGLAQPHAVTLDLGDLSEAKRILVCLDGWIHWPESSTVTAIAQDPRYAIAPLSLQVRDRQGRWQTAVESVGLPTSKGMVVPVDLSGKFLCNDYHVRLATNLCVYFDRIFVATRDEAERCRVRELPVAHADLHYRGFCRMTRDRFGYERFDYEDVGPTGSWSPPQGMFTRYGEVTPLLTRADDQYVVFGPGDQLVLRFDATSLPGLPEGWVRDFVFYANGWVKDGDLNTALSERVEPLPFHGMSGYPYGPEESYPWTVEVQRYLRAYQTRPSAPTTGRMRGE